jgi:predicted secreted protein
MATQAKAAFGVTVSRAGALVGEIIEMGNVKFSRDFIDVTNHQSPGGYEEFIASGVIKTGELTITCNSLIADAAQIAVKKDWEDKTSAVYTIAFPDGTGFTGTGYITEYEYETAIADQIKLTFTIKWSGELSDSVTQSNNLSDLVITTASLTPAFAAATYDYIATSTGDTGTVTATFSAGTATLYRNDVMVQDLVSTTPSGSVSFGADGDLTILKIVVVETGKAAKTYTVRVANV